MIFFIHLEQEIRRHITSHECWGMRSIARFFDNMILKFFNVLHIYCALQKRHQSINFVVGCLCASAGLSPKKHYNGYPKALKMSNSLNRAIPTAILWIVWDYTFWKVASFFLWISKWRLTEIYLGCISI